MCQKPGIDGFAPAVEGFPIIKGFRSLKGIAILIDNDGPDRIKTLRRQLKRCGFVQATSNYGGHIEGQPVAIVPLPSKNEYGDLEKVCLPALYTIWPGAEECVEEFLESTGALEWKKQHQLWKAKVRCAISGHFEKDPYRGVGFLLKNKKFTQMAKHPCFDRLVYFLQNFSQIILNPDL